MYILGWCRCCRQWIETVVSAVLIEEENIWKEDKVMKTFIDLRKNGYFKENTETQTG